MAKYHAVLFSTDGGFVTDYHNMPDIETVWDRINDQGSKWFFYPYPVVTRCERNKDTKRARVADACWPFEDMKGKSIKTFGRMLDNLPPDEHMAILNA